MRKLWSEPASARAIGKAIKDWFRSRPQGALGVALEGNRAYLSLVGEKESGQVQVLWQDMVEAGTGLSERAEGEEATSWPQEDLLELACLKAADHVPDQVACCLALREDQVYYYERFFPEMKSGELHQAVRLDFGAASAWQEKFYCSYQAMGQGMLRVGGIKARELSERLRGLQREFGLVQGVLVCRDDMEQLSLEMAVDVAGDREAGPPGANQAEAGAREALEEGGEAFRAAAYAAICGLRDQGIVFRPYRQYLCRWNWLHLTEVMWGAAMVCLAVLWGTGWYMEQDMAGRIHGAESRLQLMQDIDARARQIAEDRKVIDQKNRMLADLSTAPATGQGMLSRLGRGLREGIWLTEARSQGDGTLSIRGRADLYGYISALLEDMNRQGEAGAAMSLENADMGKDGRIDFLISGKV